MHMTETNLDQQPDCVQYAFQGQPDNPNLRRIFIKKGGKLFAIAVSTLAYIAQLQSAKQSLDPELDTEEKILPLDNIVSVEEICRQLSTTPFRLLAPYLVEQEELPKEEGTTIDPILELPFSEEEL